MSRRFERLSGNVEAIAIGLVVLVVLVAYLLSR